MSDQIALLAANIVCPRDGAIAVLTCSTTDMVATLSATAHLGTLCKSGNFFTMVCYGGDLYFRFTSTAPTAAGSVSRTGTTGVTRSFPIKDGVPFPFRFTKEGTGTSQALRTKIAYVCTAAAKRVHIYMSSEHGSNETQRGI